MTHFIAPQICHGTCRDNQERKRLPGQGKDAACNSPQYILMSKMSMGQKVLICSMAFLNKYGQFVK